MKITRRQLRQLINEALKPFFMGVPPTDIIDRLLEDDTIDDRFKEMLKDPDPQTQRMSLELIQSYYPTIGMKYPELSSYNISSPKGAPDLTHRSQPSYKKEYEAGKQRAEDLAIKQNISSMGAFDKIELIEKLAFSTYTTVFPETHVGHPHRTKTLILRGDDPQAFGPGLKQLDKEETKQFMKRIQDIGLYNSVYIQQPHQIIFVFPEEE